MDFGAILSFLNSSSSLLEFSYFTLILPFCTVSSFLEPLHYPTGPSNLALFEQIVADYHSTGFCLPVGSPLSVCFGPYFGFSNQPTVRAFGASFTPLRPFHRSCFFSGLAIFRISSISFWLFLSSIVSPFLGC